MPRTTAVLIAVLMAAGAVGVTWLGGEAPAPPIAVVEPGGRRAGPTSPRLARGGRIDPAHRPPGRGGVRGHRGGGVSA